MLSKNLLVLGAVATSYVSAAPTISQRSPGSIWTISDFSATADTTTSSTTYAYSISENDGTPATSCNYTIPGNFEANYANIAGCASPAYHLNQGWDDALQFATLVIVNETSQFEAFYGWTASQLGGAVQADSSSQSQSTGAAKRGLTEGLELERRQGSGWSVVNFTWGDVTATTSTYDFVVVGDGNDFECTISSAPPTPEQDFDNFPCVQNSNVIISWGYSTEGFAVMTVRDNTISPGFYALFGYSFVDTWSGSASPPDNGPQTVNEA